MSHIFNNITGNSLAEAPKQTLTSTKRAERVANMRNAGIDVEFHKFKRRVMVLDLVLVQKRKDG